MRYIKSFGLFWQDFLIGDSPELAVGGLVLLGIAFAVHGLVAAAAVIIPVAVVLLLAISVLRVRAK